MPFSSSQSDAGLKRVYLRSLLRLNLSMSLLYFGAFAAAALGTPLIFWIWPELAAVMVGPIPLGWFLPGVAGYPVMVLIGARYVRSIESAEAEYSELVDEP